MKKGDKQAKDKLKNNVYRLAQIRQQNRLIICHKPGLCRFPIGVKKTAMEFRKRVTSVLRNYITTGYVVNKKMIARNYEKFLETAED